MNHTPLSELFSAVAAQRAALATHPLYQHLTTLPRVRRFMTCHVFAVWDFMTLLKRLQRDLTCVEIPWRPKPDTAAARLINEIVVGEETDLDPAGTPVSHFELYLTAMRAAGADAAPILRFAFGLAAHEPWRDLLARVAPLPEIQRFVGATLSLAETGKTHEVAAAFFFGREAVIPVMFRSLAETLDPQEGADLGPLLYYLERHVAMDSEEHGPRAEELLARLLGEDPTRIAEARAVALDSLARRASLWDAILEDLPAADKRPAPSPAMRFPAPNLLKQSFETLAPKSETLVALFYQKLFETYPHLGKLFDGVRMDRQREMLLSALLSVIRYAEDPASLLPVLSDLGARHTRYGVRPEHYPLVGETLLAAMAELGGEAFRPEMRAAWADAYSVISAAMLQA